MQPHERHVVARHLEDCERCYAAYLQQLDLTRELEQVVPFVGADYRPDFKRVWAAMQAATVRPHPSPRLQSLHYGLAALIVAALFFIPLTFGGSDLTFASPPTQPAPLTARATPDGTQPIEGTAVAMHIESDATPAPRHNVYVPLTEVNTTP
jgi:hypothetical protein